MRVLACLAFAPSCSLGNVQLAAACRRWFVCLRGCLSVHVHVHAPKLTSVACSQGQGTVRDSTSTFAADACLCLCAIACQTFLHLPIHRSGRSLQQATRPRQVERSITSLTVAISQVAQGTSLMAGMAVTTGALSGCSAVCAFADKQHSFPCASQPGSKSVHTRMHMLSLILEAHIFLA